MDAARQSMQPLPAYRSHKKVWALQIESVVKKGTDTTTDENEIVEVTFVDHSFSPAQFNLAHKPTPSAGWYMVKYEEGGYISFSPREQFEAGYTRITRDEEGTWHGIGWAIEQMRNGARVCRPGWNGKGLFLFLVPGSRFQVNRAPLLGIYPEGTEIEYQAHVDMKTAQGSVVPWLASQSDLLATDWQIAE